MTDSRSEDLDLPDKDPGQHADRVSAPAWDDGSTPSRAERFRVATVRAAARARDLDRSPTLQRAVRRLRDVLPGDSHFGDPLSLGGTRHTEAAGRAIVGLTGGRPGVVRELGLGGVQLWQSVLERVGRGGGEHEVALVFTDLVEFSRWSLEAGDDEVLRVLRRVGEAWEPPMTERAGTVVKRLGDAARADEILISGEFLGRLDARTVSTRRRRRLNLKGVPDGLEVYAVEPAQS